MMNSVAMGLAGELRVMSELLLRGYNPAKSYLDNGIDLILADGRKIQVKTTLCKQEVSKSKTYRFIIHFYKGTYKRKAEIEVDFIICFIIPTQDFFIIPVKEVKDKVCIAFHPEKKSRYTQYLNNWNILKE